MRLFALGPDGEPTGDAYELPDGVVTWDATAGDAVPLIDLASLPAYEMVVMLTEEQSLAVLRYFGGDEMVNEYLETLAAEAAWESEGGSHV